MMKKINKLIKQYHIYNLHIGNKMQLIYKTLIVFVVMIILILNIILIMLLI